MGEGNIADVVYLDFGKVKTRLAIQETRIKNGVPQGSVTGPLLFLLFVNDLPNNSNVLFIDDDVKMVSPRS